MRQIGTLPDPQQAQRFADYLLTQGITTKIDTHDGVATLWVREEDQVPRASEELATFTREPESERYAAAVPEAQSLRREAERKEKQFRRNLIDVRRRWGSAGATGRRPVTNVLIGISVLVAVLTSFGKDDADGRVRPVTNLLLSSPYYDMNGGAYSYKGLQEVRHGQVWRLVTPIFIHYGPMHLLFNMMWLHQLAGLVEIRRGSLHFAGIVLAIALCSNMAQYAATGTGFGGMSGVVFGVFGYVWMKSRFDPGAGLYIDRQNVVLMLIWGLVCTTGLMGPIANWAHGVGLATGMAIGYAPVAWRKISRQ